MCAFYDNTRLIIHDLALRLILLQHVLLPNSIILLLHYQIQINSMSQPWSPQKDAFQGLYG